MRKLDAVSRATVIETEFDLPSFGERIQAGFTPMVAVIMVERLWKLWEGA